MVGTDAGCDADLEVLRFGDQVAGEVAGVEGCSDQNLGVLDVFLEVRVRSLLIVRDDELVTLAFKPFTDAELLGCQRVA